MADSSRDLKEKSWENALVFLAAAGLILILFKCALFGGSLLLSSRTVPSIPGLQTSRTIGLAMFSYANDHDGKYPTGKSSTEVFQKLLDEKYISDPNIFWLDLPGKKKPTSTILKPENVGWDVTADLDSNSPDEVPIVFLSGFQIPYVPDARAVPRFKDYKGRPEGISVCYKSNGAKWINEAGLPDGSIPGFISPSFAPAGKTYLQLTPDGPLKP